MKVLIFGGTGFIGRNLILELVGAGYEVGVVTRDSQKTGRLGKGVKAIEWDCTAANWPEVDGLEDFNAIVNLAGESIGNRRWSKPVKEQILNSRVQTTRAIVKAIMDKRIRPRVLINASAVGFYGPRGEDEITEKTPAGKDFLARVCRAWEDEAQKARALGVRVVPIRIGVVLGEAGALARMKTPFRFFLGGPLGNGNQWMSWIHVKDLTGLIRFAIEKENINGPVNATAPEPLRMKDFCQVLGSLMGRPSWLPVPALMLKIVLGEMADMLLNSQRVLPEKIIREGFVFKFSSLKNALGDILGRA